MEALLSVPNAPQATYRGGRNQGEEENHSSCLREEYSPHVSHGRKPQKHPEWPRTARKGPAGPESKSKHKAAEVDSVDPDFYLDLLEWPNLLQQEYKASPFKKYSVLCFIHGQASFACG